MSAWEMTVLTLKEKPFKFTKVTMAWWESTTKNKRKQARQRDVFSYTNDLILYSVFFLLITTG